MNHVWTIVELVAAPFAAAIASLVVALLTRKLQQAGLDLSAAQQERLKTLATEAILAVEERAHREPMTGADKHAAAFVILKDRAPETPASEINHQLDANLPEVRAALKGPTPGTPATLGLKPAPGA